MFADKVERQSYLIVDTFRSDFKKFKKDQESVAER